ncbi:MAG: hypothetical protein JJ901_13930 [Erythrobacter sp.]|uniref:hypothetical protein n=1 Tax=Erythrobacter sp. TaxID=1042 RepID=UPI001B249702|nr:hypothetical protein [Erythrobacter sp.]MBO6769385.1 hypothetical protein [Erythrobacter sp.]
MERASLICSVNRALLGEVGPALRLVVAKADRQEIVLRFYFDGEPSAEDRESANCAGTEVIADFPEYDLAEQIERCDAPEKIALDSSWLTIFARREPASAI